MKEKKLQTALEKNFDENLKFFNTTLKYLKKKWNKKAMSLAKETFIKDWLRHWVNGGGEYFIKEKFYFLLEEREVSVCDFLDKVADYVENEQPFLSLIYADLLLIIFKELESFYD